MKKRILAVGGGSGGHVTPVVAVLRELRRSEPDIDIHFWCDRGFAPQAKRIVADFDADIPVQTVVSGKLRRYAHLTFLQHLTIPSVVWPNVRDGFAVIIGTIQAVFKLIAWRPDVVFTKGGYVCLPVGWAAALLHIPLVIHDSDAHPGLTSRLLARYAVRIATGAPLKYYSYPASKSKYVGVPIASGFTPFSDQQKRQAKKTLGIDEGAPLIVITGGGLGARRINTAIADNLPALLELGTVILLSGSDQYEELKRVTPQNNPQFKLFSFVSKEMVLMLGAADVVVSRAGQTTILELAALATPTVLVPNDRLTGGHQTKNAAVYADEHAVLLSDESLFDTDPEALIRTIRQLIQDPALRAKIASNLHKFARPNAAKEVAAMILDSAIKK